MTQNFDYNREESKLICYANAYSSNIKEYYQIVEGKRIDWELLNFQKRNVDLCYDEFIKTVKIMNENGYDIEYGTDGGRDGIYYLQINDEVLFDRDTKYYLNRR